MSDKAQEVVECFQHRYEDLCREGLITPEMLTNYSLANDASLHSRIQTALLLAGIDTGLWAFPEVKVRLKEPLDKWAIGVQYRGKSFRYQHTLTVDVAFFNGTDMVGFGEVYTLDMIHGAIPANRVNPYHKLKHLVREFDGFVIIVTTLPSAADPGTVRLPSHKEIRQYSLDEWERRWCALIDELRALGRDIQYIALKR